MNKQQVTSVAERVNLAPTNLDEKNILEIQNTLEVGVSEAMRSSIHLFADILRLGMLEKIQREVSEEKTIRLYELMEENSALRV